MACRFDLRGALLFATKLHLAIAQHHAHALADSDIGSTTHDGLAFVEDDRIATFECCQWAHGVQGATLLEDPRTVAFELARDGAVEPLP